MTVIEFDILCRGPVDYTIYLGDEIIEFFTRDILQDPQTFRRNMVKFDRYLDAEIFDIYSMNDIIRVMAKVKTDR